jgi:hypothetical protein
MSDAKMPKPFQGFYGPGQGLDASYVNPTPVRLVGAGEREIFNEERIQRHSVAHDSGVATRKNGRGGGNVNEMGGR